MALFLRHRPESHGMLPDGEDVTPERKMAIASEVVEGFTTRQALKERNLWLLSLTFMLSMAPLNAVGIFMIPYLTDPKDEHGLAIVGGIAGAAVTIMTLTSLVGRFGFGWLGDRYDIRRILIWCFVMQSAGLVVLAFVQNLWHLIPFFILFAPSYGGLIVLRPVIFANYFGRRSLGAIQGLSMSMMTVGGVLTPLLIGSLRDSTGGYSVPFLVLAVVMLLAIPLILCVRHRYIGVTE
jgi:OFA family oxalate/formate antiporter-like MFS transporter